MDEPENYTQIFRTPGTVTPIKKTQGIVKYITPTGESLLGWNKGEGVVTLRVDPARPILEKDQYAWTKDKSQYQWMKPNGQYSWIHEIGGKKCQTSRKQSVLSNLKRWLKSLWGL